MTVKISEFLTQVKNLIPSASTELGDVVIYQQIKAAVQSYGNVKPNSRTEDVTGDGGKYYNLETSLSNWRDDLSFVTSIQYPAPTIASDESSGYLEDSDWNDKYELYSAGTTTRYLFLPNHNPAATESIRLTYATPYQWIASASTTAVNQVAHGFSVDDGVYQDAGAIWMLMVDLQLLPTHIVSAVAGVDNFTAAELAVNVPYVDYFSVCCLSASLCCQIISTNYSRTSQSTIGADSVNHSSRASEFSQRRIEFENCFRKHLGLPLVNANGMIDDKGLGASGPAFSTFVDLDSEPGYPAGRSYLFHKSGRR